ncbi:SOS response-associated peptidase [Mucilaginibacter endophyticus]|uniref:SOS response-associated peptidase n=1 Tax=Mucilaginibacter endophyticus TaxID=2675003 RepID=UPI000E0E05ED|nr:SOS response-associated peptidase [Mucilaginibacter endophyticus]
MCARYVLEASEKEIEQAYAAKMQEEYVRNWNIAPTNKACVITADHPDIIQQYHFGLVPHWAKDKKVGYSLLNARSESALEKPSFKPLIEKNKRCLVLVNSFYEWETVGKEKLPYRFFLPERPTFSFAGLYSWWKDPASQEWYKSFTIMTTAPNGTVGQFHDRMPVILSKEEESIWLKGGVPISDIMSLCDPFPEVEMDLHRVSKDVNNVRNNNSDLILPENSN